ncbi:MAG: hypothetical protein K0U41_09980 [Gammaproteobacteria bacterium]|nr:hypothetical protein [Gammaproteobacteria bacterium]
MAIKLTNRDCVEIHKAFPSLECDYTTGQISGRLRFASSYLQKNNDLQHAYKNKAVRSRLNFIEDNYRVQILVNDLDNFGAPKVYDKSGRINDFSIKSRTTLEDLHMYSKEQCCVGILVKYKWRGAARFIVDTVIPFFYWQSHRANFGHQPWRCLSHGIKGLCESINFSERDFRNNHDIFSKCPCGQGGIYKNCCMKNHLNLQKIALNSAPPSNRAQSNKYHT